jgi:hypothetical protein
MKLAIALACLIASLSLATHALADTTATLQQPVAKPTQFIVDHALWDCSGTTCVSSGVEEMYFGAQECHAVAKNAGVAVADFKASAPGHTLRTAELDKCNAGLAPKTSVAAAH